MGRAFFAVGGGDGMLPHSCKVLLLLLLPLKRQDLPLSSSLSLGMAVLGEGISGAALCPSSVGLNGCPMQCEVRGGREKHAHKHS